MRTMQEIKSDLRYVERWLRIAQKKPETITAHAKKLLEINRHQLLQELKGLESCK